MQMSSALRLFSISASSIEAREFSTKQRKKLAKKGQALPDGSFPIANTSDLHNAIKAIGRAKNYSKAKAHIISRARALGATKMLPDGWIHAGGPGSGRKAGDDDDLSDEVKQGIRRGKIKTQPGDPNPQLWVSKNGKRRK